MEVAFTPAAVADLTAATSAISIPQRLGAWPFASEPPPKISLNVLNVGADGQTARGSWWPGIRMSSSTTGHPRKLLVCGSGMGRRTACSRTMRGLLMRLGRGNARPWPAASALHQERKSIFRIPTFGMALLATARLG